jgi:hypothetical protein
MVGWNKYFIGNFNGNGTVMKGKLFKGKQNQISNGALKEMESAILLDKITVKTNAVSQYVLPEENIETKVPRFYSKISEPMLTGLEVKIEDASPPPSKRRKNNANIVYHDDRGSIIGSLCKKC